MSVPTGAGRADFGHRIGLTLTLALAAFALVAALVMLTIEPKPLPFSGFGTERQDAETLLYAVAFFLVLPLAAIWVPRLADRIAAGPNAAGLPVLTALLAATSLAAVLVVRLTDVFSWGGGMGTMLAVIGLWSAAAVAVIVRAARGGAWPSLLRLSGYAGAAWGLAAALLLGVFLATTTLRSIDPLALVLGILLVPVVTVAIDRDWLPRLRGRWGATGDVVIAVLILLAVPDLVIFRPEAAATSQEAAFETYIIQFHHDYLLGPANQVLGGNAMLVDTASQYGVGWIYFLAGWFNLAPIGYGTYGFLDGLVTALLFVTGYSVLRVAGASRLLAASALFMAVVALAFNLAYSIGGLPQQGPMRFGLPMGVILATVVGTRWPRASGAASVVALVTLAVSSVWALEAFAYTAATFAALACFTAYLMTEGSRLRWLGRQALLALAACAVAHLLLAATTLAGTGELPDWGQYFAYLETFLLGDLGDFTYDFTRWSPGIAVGAAYFASATGVLLLVRGWPDLVRRERVTLLALAGVSAYGIVLFTYFINRSLVSVLPYVSFPAVLAGALWLSLLLRSPQVQRAARLAGVALATAAAVLVVGVAWSSVDLRFERSALAHVIPGGDSLGAALDRLWHPPALNPRAPEGERLLARYMPDEDHSLVLVEPDLATEILIRSGRADTLPLGDAQEDSYVPDEREPGIAEAVDGLQPGDRLLLNSAALDALAKLHADPSYDPFTAVLTKPGQLAPVQEWALQRIDDQFRIEIAHRGQEGFVVAELGPR